jgi:uncharacterized protein YwqG
VPSIRELLTTFGLAHIAGDIEACVKSSIYLTSGEESDAACSRLGGSPNFPKELDWPVWENTPLPFVAQLDLSEIPRIESLPLPAAGSLYFFYEGGENAWGFQPKDKGSAQVIYAPSALSDIPLRNLPEDIPNELRFSGVRLESAPPGTSLPDFQDQVIERLHLTADECGKYVDFLEAWRQQQPATRHRVGGYPEPIQGDPKLEAQLASHGFYCGGASGYQQGEQHGLDSGAADWELLFQVDSDDAADMMWGDVGCLYFLIRREDLVTQSFEKAWLVFQCC